MTASPWRMPLCSSLHDDGAWVVDEVGSKAWNLHHLAVHQMPVPAGFAWSARALDLHLDQKRPSGPLRSRHGTDLVSFCSDMITAPLPRLVVTELKRMRQQLPGALIVRSSAVGEDGDSASFAGQLDSIAPVESFEALQVALKKVWASAWSERSLFYQQARGCSLRGVGVVVQRLVAARVSGVLFTVSPSRGNQMRAEFCGGPGEALVSGRIAPGVIESSRDHQDSAITGWPEQQPRVTAFDHRSVMEMGRRIEAIYRGIGQDIEWCIDIDEQLHVVQSRPITTPLRDVEAIAPQRQVRFSNANVNENFPNPMSPMLYSIARQGYAAYFENLARMMGLDEARIAAAQPALQSIVGVHNTRLYYNLSSLHGCLRVAPFGDWLTSSFNVFVGIDGGAAERSQLLPARSVVVESAAALRFVAHGSAALATASYRLPTFERDVDDFASMAHSTLLPFLADDELEALLRRFLDIRLHRWGPAALGDVSAMVGYGVLRSFLARVLHNTDETLQNELLKGLADIVSGIPTQQLWELAQQRRNQDPHYATNLAWFLEAWGFRRSGELELTRPTLQDDPTPVLAIIEQFAASDGPSPSARTAGHARDREQRTEEVIAATAWPLRPALRALLRFTRNAIGLRERARLKQALLYTRLGPVIATLGQRLHLRGELEQSDDVFMLSIDELLDHLAGTSMFGACLAETCALRRHQHARMSSTVAPDSFVIERGRYQVTSPAVESTHAGLVGTPAAAGRAQGRAAVLHDAQHAQRMSRGDVLVTKQTDPGWGPVLFLASALVIERGGMLSHGAIIAREFGVPCVVGVHQASTRIGHGQWLDVDGDRGVVRIIDEPA